MGNGKRGRWDEGIKRGKQTSQGNGNGKRDGELGERGRRGRLASGFGLCGERGGR